MEDYEELAAYVLGQHGDEEIDPEIINDSLVDRLGFDLCTFQQIADLLIRLTIPMPSALDPDKRFHVFGHPDGKAFVALARVEAQKKK